MRFLSFLAAFVALSNDAFAVPPPSYGQKPACPADKCFSSIRLSPLLAPIASSFCKKYINHKTTTCTAVRTSTLTQTRTIAPGQSTVTDTTTITPPVITASACATVTTTAPFSTYVLYPSRGNPAATVPTAAAAKRAAALAIPAVLAGAHCGSGKALTSKISSACSCYLGPAKTQVTNIKTATAIVTVTARTQPAITITVRETARPTSVPACTSTVTGTPPALCGNIQATTYTTGTRTCPSAASPTEVNALHRIEGDSAEGTIFEDCIVTGPRQINTTAGGAHDCGGGASPAPTITDQLDAASRAAPAFDYDGIYQPTLANYRIDRIRQTTATDTQLWSPFRNDALATDGGCGTPVASGDRTAWLFDALSRGRGLRVGPDYAVVPPRGRVEVTVQSFDLFDGGAGPFGGAAFAGRTSDGDGGVAFQAPAVEGCYQYKATADGLVRSNTFYLSVTNAFAVEDEMPELG